jgi:hypothetical protein
MTGEQRGYHSYLLRFWRAGGGDTPEWRITLEDVRTRQRYSFASAARLAAFLDARIHGAGDCSPARHITTTLTKGGQAMMFISIALSKGKDEQAFERFMMEEIFPAIPKYMRRDGQVTGLVLLKGNNTGHTNEYLWLVYGAINGGAAVQQIEAIETYGATVTPMIDYVECSSWFADGQDSEREQPLPTDQGA